MAYIDFFLLYVRVCVYIAHYFGFILDLYGFFFRMLLAEKKTRKQRQDTNK